MQSSDMLPRRHVPRYRGMFSPGEQDTLERARHDLARLVTYSSAEKLPRNPYGLLAYPTGEMGAAIDERKETEMSD